MSNVQREKVYFVSDASGNFLHYSQLKSAVPANWNETSFKRWLVIDDDCGFGFCLTVTAYVSHPDLSQDVQISMNLYDWMPMMMGP